MKEKYPEIINFINNHHVLTLCTCVNNMPYCANMFYVYADKTNSFIFTSDKKTKHIQDALINNKIAGSIVLETETVGKIQGLQFQGEISEIKGAMKLKALKVYLSRFPYAIIKTTPLWMLTISYAKFTDNRLGFGKKLIWLKEQEGL